MATDIPDTLFKYESFNTLSLRNLKAQSIYFSSPTRFNDPYDCALNVAFARPTPEEVEAMRRSYLDRDDVPDDTKRFLECVAADQVEAIVVNAVRAALNGKITERGVCCFSEVNDSLLMWAHYGGQYKGYCLEFRTACDDFAKIRKVRYTDSMPEINISLFYIHDDFSEILDLYCTKSTAWSYEREWRAFHQDTNKLYCHKADALKAVYFGPDMETEAMEIICLILTGQNPEVELWKGARSPTLFKVEFERFTYTPYIDAKRAGLR